MLVSEPAAQLFKVPRINLIKSCGVIRINIQHC
jgi:hypothetical protein